jgi:hypothetical protein
MTAGGWRRDSCRIPKREGGCMKKGFIAAALLCVFLNVGAYAFDTTLLDLRGTLFSESQDLKTLLADSKDVLLVSSMWDSCIMTVTQIDAYFSMLGIFNTIKKENISEAAIDYLTGWLGEIKRTNDLNMRSLDSVPQVAQHTTKGHMEKLKAYFKDLDAQISVELKKIAPLNAALKIKKK